MKMEVVQAQLKRWGELIVTTAAGEVYELHLGDTSFDFEQRTISFKSADSEWVVDGDSIETIRMHYSHRATGEE